MDHVHAFEWQGDLFVCPPPCGVVDLEMRRIRRDVFEGLEALGIEIVED